MVLNVKLSMPEVVTRIMYLILPLSADVQMQKLRERQLQGIEVVIIHFVVCLSEINALNSQDPIG
jgi:hypothetical protein